MTDASNVGGGGTLFQWQALEKEKFDSAISKLGTDGLNKDGTLKHSYPDDKWIPIVLGHWNWKWNQARGNYSIYEQELVSGMLVLSCQARLLGSNPVVWLCDQEPFLNFQKGPPPEARWDPRGHLWVTWGVYLCAGKPPLADIILSHPPDLTRCDSVIGLAIPAMSGHIQYRGGAS